MSLNSSPSGQEAVLHAVGCMDVAKHYWRARRTRCLLPCMTFYGQL